MSKDIATWTALAIQYGPFFFSLLFLMIIGRSAGSAYHAVCRRTDPPARPREVEAYRLVYLSTFAIGIALVAVSVGWWLKYRPTEYVYKGTLKRLRNYERIESDGSVYFRSQYFAPNPPQEQLRNEHFIAVQNAPFSEDQGVEVDFVKAADGPEARDTRDTLRIPYVAAIDEPAFAIEFDVNTRKNRVVVLGQKPEKSAHASWRHSPLPFVSVAYADDVSPAVAHGTEAKSDVEVECRSALTRLRDPEAAVSVKILAARKLLKLEAEHSLRYCLTTFASGEPPLVTLADLTRHSDQELSFLAAQVLSQFGFEPYLVQELVAASPESRRRAEAVFVRLSARATESVLSQLQRTGAMRDADLARLRRMAQEAVEVRATATSAGDRYYGVVSWPAHSVNANECLTPVFSQVFAKPADASPVEGVFRRQLFVMKSKTGVVDFARRVRDCGGAVAFDVPSPSCRDVVQERHVDGAQVSAGGRAAVAAACPTDAPVLQDCSYVKLGSSEARVDVASQGNLCQCLVSVPERRRIMTFFGVTVGPSYAGGCRVVAHCCARNEAWVAVD